MDALVGTFLREYFELLYRNFDPKRDMTVKLGKGEVRIGPKRTSPLLWRSRTPCRSTTSRSFPYTFPGAVAAQAATIPSSARSWALRPWTWRTFRSLTAS